MEAHRFLVSVPAIAGLDASDIEVVVSFEKLNDKDHEVTHIVLNTDDEIPVYLKDSKGNTLIDMRPLIRQIESNSNLHEQIIEWVHARKERIDDLNEMVDSIRQIRD